MELTELYKLHINPNADGADLVEFYHSFDLGFYVRDPDPFLAKIQEEDYNARKNAAREWILENSKISDFDRHSYSRPQNPFIC